MTYSWTPEQLESLIPIIDDRIAKLLSIKDKSCQYRHIQKPYHTVPELRKLLKSNIEELKAAIPDETFSLPVLLHEFRKLITLRDGDLEVIHCGLTRLESQLRTALKDRTFNADRVISTPARGRYRFIDSATQTLFDAK